MRWAHLLHVARAEPMILNIARMRERVGGKKEEITRYYSLPFYVFRFRLRRHDYGDIFTGCYLSPSKMCEADCWLCGGCGGGWGSLIIHKFSYFIQISHDDEYLEDVDNSNESGRGIEHNKRRKRRQRQTSKCGSYAAELFYFIFEKTQWKNRGTAAAAEKVWGVKMLCALKHISSFAAAVHSLCSHYGE